MSERIGFVGVGRMGANMARHLKLDCGREVTAVYDIDRGVADSLAKELGAVVPENLAEVAAVADVIITVITDDEAHRRIFMGEGGNLLDSAKEKTFINCATLSPQAHRDVYEAAKKGEADVLEGCMASSISHAREGKLYLMIGGEEEVFEKNRSLLEDLSCELRYCGEIGRAAQVKALVNMVMNINTAGLAEGLGLANALGIDLNMIQDVFSQTGANSRVLETDAEDMIARDHEAWFMAEHAAKDSGLAKDLADDAGLTLPLNEATKAQYDKLTRIGKGQMDKSAVSELTFLDRA